jgi:thiamine transporter 2/3
LEVLYGIASSTEVAYYTYIYAKVDKETYKKVTSHTYTALLIGNFIAAVVSQILVSSDLMNYKQLNYLTLGSVSLAFVVACFLPNVKQSVYFHRRDNDGTQEIHNNDEAAVTSFENRNQGKKLPLLQKVRRAYGYLFLDFKKAYSNKYVLKWSVWCKSWKVKRVYFFLCKSFRILTLFVALLMLINIHFFVKWPF